MDTSELAKAPLAGRRLLQVTGGLDAMLPPWGGPGTISDGEGGVLILNQWEDSVLAYAKANGYTGARAALLQNDTLLEKVSYLGGQVMGVNYKQGGHIVCGDPPGCTDILDEFMNGNSPRSPPPPPAPLTSGEHILGGRSFRVCLPTGISPKPGNTALN